MASSAGTGAEAAGSRHPANELAGSAGEDDESASDETLGSEGLAGPASTAVAAAAADRGLGAPTKAAPADSAGSGGFGGRILGDEERPGCVRPILLIVALAVLVLLLALVLSQCGGDNGATTDDGSAQTTDAADGDGAAAPTDADIRSRAMAALSDAGYDGVTVEVHDGTVRLFGNVATADDRAGAEGVVSGLDGVRAIDNQLVATQGDGGAADGGAAEEEDAGATPLSDDELETMVVTALTDAGVDVDGVTVVVEDGVATMTGAVPSDEQLAAAATAAGGVGGLTGVNNEIVAADGETPPADPVESDASFTG